MIDVFVFAVIFGAGLQIGWGAAETVRELIGHFAEGFVRGYRRARGE